MAQSSQNLTKSGPAISWSVGQTPAELGGRPFPGGDQIEVGDVAGTVEGITIRETGDHHLSTDAGSSSPNAKVYTPM